MKYFKILAILLCSTIISFYSCKDNSKSTKQDSIKSAETAFPSNPANTAPINSATQEPAQNAQGVWHYTCNTGCSGGAGSAINCKTCGNLLAHNQSYHANSTPTPNTPFANLPATTEPSQNTAGVWHFTCGKGCAGGSGSAGSCTNCGGTMNHNAAYHQ